MKVRSLCKRVAFVAAASTLALGCELIVDFDRSRIPVEAVEAGPDATVIVDGSILEASTATDGSILDAATTPDADADISDAADGG